jgi:hypothetical protein
MKAMNDERSIAGLVNYIESRKPEFIEIMRGADDALIYQLERLVEEVTDTVFPYPEEYLEFLRTMGGKMPIPFGYDAAMEASEVLKTYEFRRKDGEKPPTGFIIIAGGEEQIVLECLTDDKGFLKSGKVFWASGERLKNPLADSFFNFLFRRAFEYCASAHLQATATFIGTTKETSLLTIGSLMETFGWQKQWFSDSVTLCMTDEKNDLVLYSEQPPGEYNWLKLAGNNKDQITLLGKKICQTANMEFEKWW